MRGRTLQFVRFPPWLTLAQGDGLSILFDIALEESSTFDTLVEHRARILKNIAVPPIDTINLKQRLSFPFTEKM